MPQDNRRLFLKTAVLGAAALAAQASDQNKDTSETLVAALHKGTLQSRHIRFAACR